MSHVFVVFAALALMIFINGLFVSAEFATVAARKTRISQLATNGNVLARQLLPIMENSKTLDNYIAACQVGITISSLLLGAYAQDSLSILLIPFLNRLGISPDITDSIAVVIILITITAVQVIIGELFPKSIAVQYPETVALNVSLPVRWSMFLFQPLIWLFNGSGRAILYLFGRSSKGDNGQLHSAQEIEMLMTESHEGGLLDDRERQMLRNAFRLRELNARQVMVHRTKIIAAPANSTIKELMELAIEEGYSRIPLYRGTIDDIIGFVHIKDLFRLYVQNSPDVKSIIREVMYIPETMPIVEAWEALNLKRKYIAIIFDEYGGTAGLITIEDLIEEIVGELQDEFDDEMALVSRDKEGRIYLRGDLLVTDVNEYLNLNLPIDAADTLSGLIFSVLGRPPVLQDRVTIGDVMIQVEAMEDLSVAEASIHFPESETANPFGEWEVADHE